REQPVSETLTPERASDKPAEMLERVVIRFAGDSGDGMQLTGDRFTSASALFGNDLSTLPDFPAEIRAPAGTLAGVSAFQAPIVEASNTAAFKAGYHFGETAELFDHHYQVKPARLEPGTYRQITGNQALAYGILACGQLAKLPVFLGSYPITPASDILHELSKHKNFGIRTLQAEDEIAGIGAALGAAFGGHLGYTTTSGPGMALKAETMGLAVSLELPLVIIDIQRGGPSTGLPTKTAAAD